MLQTEKTATIISCSVVHDKAFSFAGTSLLTRMSRHCVCARLWTDWYTVTDRRLHPTMSILHVDGGILLYAFSKVTVSFFVSISSISFSF